jgi:hypothetical protein
MKGFVLAFAISILWASNAFSWVESISVDPFKPAVGDSVTVTVRGLMPNSCWKVVGQHGYGAGGRDISIEVETYDFGGRPLDHCLMVLVPYEVVCSYRLPTSGPYTVQATEYCDSLSPCTGGTVTGEFDTRGPDKDFTETVTTTWSTLKSYYR